MNVATLMVYRGDTLDREVELGEGIARIGRAGDNDIVLDDPTFTVSRKHAELHFEQGGYSLTDKNSENGLWVAGKRVATTTLAPGIPVVLGCYKLVLKAEQPPPVQETVLVRPMAESPDATILLGAPVIVAPPAAAVPPPAPAEAPKIVRTPVSPPAPAPVPAPPPPAAASEPRAAPAPVKPQPAPAPPSATPKERGPGRTVPRGLLYAGMAVVVIAGITTIAVRMSFKSRAVASTEAKAAPPPPPAIAGPATAVPPAAPPPPATVPPSASDVSSPPVTPPQTPVGEAPPTPNPVSPLSSAPAQSSPRDAAPPPVRPKAAPRQVTSGPTKPPRARSAAPRAGSAVPTVAPKPKPVDLTSMFEAARSAMIKEDYLGAIAGFEAVLKISPDYPNAANLLSVAHGGATNASHLAVEDAGNKAEMSGDYAEAARQYDRALQLDPSSREAADAMRRLKVRMQREGQDAVKRGQASEAAGRTAEAIAAYEKALRLLPADDPSAKIVSDRLAVLKAGN